MTLAPRFGVFLSQAHRSWDETELPGTATEGVTESIEARVRQFDAASREAGRDPASIRRSTWAEAP
jgi:hypothetical protein